MTTRDWITAIVISFCVAAIIGLLGELLAVALYFTGLRHAYVLWTPFYIAILVWAVLCVILVALDYAMQGV